VETVAADGNSLARRLYTFVAFEIIQNNVWLLNKREDYRISWGRKNVEYGDSIRLATSEVYKVLCWCLSCV
jgi:hypothetical protein